MKKGEIYEGRIERTDYPNRGTVLVGDTPVIVKNGIPGQKIRFVISKKRSGRCEGRLLEVLERSPLEDRERKCGIFPDCGGCTYQTMSYENQLKLKEEQVKRLLQPFIAMQEKNSGTYTECTGETAEKSAGAAAGAAAGMVAGKSAGEAAGKSAGEAAGKSAGEVAGKPAYSASQDLSPQDLNPDTADPVWEGIIGSPVEFAYRNKMEFSFGDAYKGGPLTLGLHKKGSSHDVLTAYNCAIVPPDFVRILNTVHQYFIDREIPYYHKMNHTGYLRHLLLREGANTGEILVHIVTTSQMHLDLRPLADKLMSIPLDGQIVGILHVINDSLSDVVQSDRTIVLYGRDHFYEELLGLRFRISSFSFFQPNTRAAGLLYSKVREYTGDVKDQVVYDLYCGTGTISQMAAAAAKEVIGVEIVEEAVKSARENAVLNGIENCRFICGDVLKTIDELETKPDLIILDPPRDGIHPKALPKILNLNVPRIIYISCKPTSLARDLPAFIEAGYQIKKACCLDQFCQTVHVETVCLLYREKVDFVSVPYEPENADYLKRISGSATYEEIKEWIMKKYNTKVSSLYVAQIKAKHGIDMRDCYNRPRSESSRQPKCPADKEKMIEDALRHFRIIE